MAKHICTDCIKVKECDWNCLEDCKAEREKNSERQLVFSEGTQTLRIMPMNYMVASFEKGHWIVDPDGAISEEEAVFFFRFFCRHENKFKKDSWKQLDVTVRS